MFDNKGITCVTFFHNSFTELYLTSNTVHTFKTYNLMVFSIVME